MDKEKSKLALKHLIDRYNSNKHLKDFIGNEKQISRSLIEPFVRDVLGWDIEDPQEFKVEVPASGKRVDILVCINGVTQFIVEAKSLTQDIVDYSDFYKQTISYAHSKEKTFAILTNFKHFIILRCDVEVDNPLKAAVKIINIENYTDDDFDLLYNFSKEIWIEKGEENPLYLKLANFKRRAKVDVELLENLKDWRQSIINNIKKHPRQNKFDFSDEKSKYEVEEEIQRFLDRIIFICYTEDKGFVDSELKSLIELKKDKHYESQSWLLDKIRSIFKKYWNDYNSDLFKFGKCDEFFIEDAVLLKILTDLRKPKDKLPYDFASIEADILGKTYENFIGHVIAGEKRFKEKESKGKRKSEGIYYTPTYIVDYIVRNTVKEYIKGKSFASINKVKILDPACGSGSFLIKAFDALAEESKNILKRELNYEEKKNLMLNCIHGVDKDERAVDICKLNLSLKLAERGQKLPELHNNIKCGDSLIDDENVAGYKAFKWKEQFKEIMDNGGFDVVIGNPPYGAEFKESEREFFKKYYLNVSIVIDSYILFIERAIKLLKTGILGFIIPESWLTNPSNWNLRKYLIENVSILKIVDIPGMVFPDATVDTVVLILKKQNPLNHKVNILFAKPKKGIEISKENEIVQSDYSQLKDFVMNTNIDKNAIKLIKKIDEKSIKLKEICKNTRGIETGDNKKYLSKIKEGKGYLPIITGDDIERYYPPSNKYHVKYGKWLSNPKSLDIFKGDKIVLQRIKNQNLKRRLVATIDKENRLILDSVHMIYEIKKEYNPFYILSLINSWLLNFYFKLFSMYPRINADDLDNLPIKNIPQEKQLHFITLADKMLSLNKNLQEIRDKNTLQKQKIQEEIKKTDKEIDELVYQLYGITEEEKKIIEESLG